MSRKKKKTNEKKLLISLGIAFGALLVVLFMGT